MIVAIPVPSSVLSCRRMLSHDTSASATPMSNIMTIQARLVSRAEIIEYPRPWILVAKYQFLHACH